MNLTPSAFAPAALFVMPFVAWLFYAIGKLVDRLAGRAVLNGASIYNWLTLAYVAVVGLSGNAEGLGRLLVAFSVSWYVGRRLSKKYKAESAANVVSPVTEG
jgi:hypothetical protein